VKLMAGVGAWLGVPWTVYVFIVTALAGGIYALGLIALRGRLRPTGEETSGIEQEVRRADRRRRLVPYAPMIAIGILAVLVWSLFWPGS
jgi:Flp pilus assembly protein protease CpaA